jgi:hypothetical protein
VYDIRNLLFTPGLFELVVMSGGSDLHLRLLACVDEEENEEEESESSDMSMDVTEVDDEEGDYDDDSDDEDEANGIIRNYNFIV